MRQVDRRGGTGDKARPGPTLHQGQRPEPFEGVLGRDEVFCPDEQHGEQQRDFGPERRRPVRGGLHQENRTDRSRSLRASARRTGPRASLWPAAQTSNLPPSMCSTGPVTKPLPMRNIAPSAMSSTGVPPAPPRRANARPTGMRLLRWDHHPPCREVHSGLSPLTHIHQRLVRESQALRHGGRSEATVHSARRPRNLPVRRA